MAPPVLRNRLLAVLAADVAGYSRLMSLDDRATVAALDAGRSVFKAHIDAFGGRVVDMAGDSVLAVFDTAVGAVRAALAVQLQLTDAAGALPAERRLLFRIGIHVGDVIEKEDGSVYGDGVNIAARLEGLAEPGAVAVSQAVQGMVGGRVAAEFEDLGEQAVKNIAQPVRAFRVVLPGARAFGAVSGQGHRFKANAGATPPAADGLFGRDELLQQVVALLTAPATRLLTLTGPGGAGKTRVGLQATAQLAPTLADGAHVVLLAPVRDARQLMSSVAMALGLQEGGAVSLAALVQGYLRPRQVLLLLDNLEHLPEAAAQVAELLQACPRLKVLATSRVRLHLADERELPVRPLALPSSNAAADVARSPAVALFAARAAVLGRDVLASAEDLQAAAEVCRRLDGLPLAIELAAARLRVLTPVALAARLQQSLPLLKGGSSDAPQRQQTLRDTIAWSHDLLDAKVQLLFRRLGVFAGGWSLEAAEALADAGTALDGIESLVDHNLVQRVDDLGREPRFAMLETIREFALEQLVLAGEDAQARDRHAAHFVALAKAGAPKLTSGGRKPWLVRLRAEMNNFRVALDWLVRQRRDTLAASDLAGALVWLWYFDGLYREGLGWMDEVMALPGAQDGTPAAAAVQSGMARLAGFMGDVPYALALAQGAVARWRALADARGLAFALFHLGIPTFMSHGRDAAVAVFQESRACFGRSGDAWGVALATVYEGVVLAFAPGAEEAALAVLNEGLARCVALGDDWAASTCSGYIGSVALRRGDLATARRSFGHILVQARETGDRFRIARGTHLMAEVDLQEGQPAAALRSLAESLALTREQGRPGDLLQLLRATARVLSALNRHADAALVLGAGTRNDGVRATLPPDDPQALAQTLAACRAALGEAAFDRAWQRGGMMTVEQAVEEALRLAKFGQCSG